MQPPHSVTLRTDVFHHRGCENCGIAPLERFEVPDRSPLWRCPACGLYQGGQLPADGAYEQAYHQGYLRAQRRKIRTAQVRLCRLARFTTHTTPTLLDVGCSIGATVAAAKRRGWPVCGVDVSRHAVEACRQQGLDCRTFNGIQLPFADRSFDVVTAWHVIEHVPRVAETLDEWFRVLRPGGLLMLETPHARCWKARLWGARYRKFWPAEHVYTFTPANLEPFVARAGFETLAVPLITQPRQVGPIAYLYAVAHQAHLAVTRVTGFSKAFQIVARRPHSAIIKRRSA